MSGLVKGGWADLPADMLRDIALRAGALAASRLGCVCRSWRGYMDDEATKRPCKEFASLAAVLGKTSNQVAVDEEGRVDGADAVRWLRGRLEAVAKRLAGTHGDADSSSSSSMPGAAEAELTDTHVAVIFDAVRASEWAWSVWKGVVSDLGARDEVAEYDLMQWEDGWHEVTASRVGCNCLARVFGLPRDRCLKVYHVTALGLVADLALLAALHGGLDALIALMRAVSALEYLGLAAVGTTVELEVSLWHLCASPLRAGYLSARAARADLQAARALWPCSVAAVSECEPPQLTPLMDSTPTPRHAPVPTPHTTAGVAGVTADRHRSMRWQELPWYAHKAWYEPLTVEQKEFVKAAAKEEVYTGSHARILLQAFAGCGKTTALAAFAKMAHASALENGNTEPRILYVVYNKAMALAAEAGAFSGMPYVECRTVHSLAYRYMLEGREKLWSELTVSDIKKALWKDGEVPNDVDYRMVTAARDAVLKWFASADAPLDEAHITDSDIRTCQGYRSKAKKTVVAMAHEIRRQMAFRGEGCNLLQTHDCYLKLYSLIGGDLADKYDIVLLDEAQDQRDCSMHPGTLVVVGDRHQHIYSFNYAKDQLTAMQEQADAGYNFRLTQTQRFGPHIAAVANRMLALLGEGVLMQPNHEVHDAVYHGVTDKRPDDCVWLSRYNAGWFKLAFKHCMFARPESPDCLAVEVFARKDADQSANKGSGKIFCDTLLALAHLKYELDWEKEVGLLSKVTRKQRETWDGLRMYLARHDDDTQLADLASFVSMADDLLKERDDLGMLKETVGRLEAAIKNEGNLKPTLRCGCVYQVKGDQFDSVALLPDFVVPDSNAPSEELRVLYVAVTRARRTLWICNNLARHLLQRPGHLRIDVLASRTLDSISVR